MQAMIDGVELFYQPVGEQSNYPLILLHGGPGLDHTELYPWHNELSDAFYLIHVDLRGQGRSQRVPPDTLSLEVFADDVSMLARKLGFDHYALLGHSFGAMITVAHAVTRKDASHYIVSSGSASMTKSMHDVEHNLETFEPVELREQVTRSWALEPSVKTQEDCARLMAMQWPFHFATSETMRRAWERANRIDPEWDRRTVYSPEVLAYFSSNAYAIEYEEQLADIAQPTLVLTGESDRTCTPRAAEDMHRRIPNSELVIVPHAGHMTFMEEPEFYFTALRNFFSRYPVPR